MINNELSKNYKRFTTIDPFVGEQQIVDLINPHMTERDLIKAKILIASYGFVSHHMEGMFWRFPELNEKMHHEQYVKLMQKINSPDIPIHGLKFDVISTPNASDYVFSKGKTVGSLALINGSGNTMQKVEDTYVLRIRDGKPFAVPYRLAFTSVAFGGYFLYTSDSRGLYFPIPIHDYRTILQM